MSDHLRDQKQGNYNAPKSVYDLFWSFTLIAMQGFGGVMAIIQREVVENKKWLTREEFLEEWAVAQVMPGPNVVNLSLMIGARYYGLRGALASLAGILFFPLVLVVILGALYDEFSVHPGVIGATRGVSAVAAGLIIATGVKLSSGLKQNSLGKLQCAVFGILCFTGIALLRWPLLGVLLVLGPLAWLLAYRALRRR